MVLAFQQVATTAAFVKYEIIRRVQLFDDFLFFECSKSNPIDSKQSKRNHRQPYCFNGLKGPLFLCHFEWNNLMCFVELIVF